MYLKLPPCDHQGAVNAFLEQQRMDLEAARGSIAQGGQGADCLL